MNRTGQCLCGAVHFVIRDANPEFGACHCKMCQRWTGSLGMNLTAPSDTVTFEGIENIGRYKSSDWAERAWCKKCGSNILYQVTADGPYHGNYHIPVGLLDDTSALNLSGEYFVDNKPECLLLEGEHDRLDTAATMALFGGEE